MLKSQSMIAGIYDKIKASDFFNNLHSRIFSAIIELSFNNKDISVISIANKCDVDIEEIKPVLNGFITEDVDTYIDIVKDFSTRRSAISIMNNAIDTMLKHNTDFNKELSNTIGSLSTVTKSNVQNTLLSVEEVMINTVLELDDKNTNVGYDTGFPSIDKKVSMQAGDLVIVAGRPSMGKTLLAINILENTCLVRDNVGIFFSLEMSANALARRILSSQCSINSRTIEKKICSEKEWSKVLQKQLEYKGKKLYIDDNSNIDMVYLRNKVQQIKVANNDRLDFVVVDYLQLMANGDDMNIEVSKITRSLKLLAKEFGLVVILLSQLNRKLETRQNKIPIMSDLRDSGAIEQDADKILFVYRDSMYNSDGDPYDAIISIGKNRNGGDVGYHIHLRYVGENCRFNDVEKHDDIDWYN
jgi:replicative DNA helicase